MWPRSAFSRKNEGETKTKMTHETKTIQIEQLLQWGKPIRKMTSAGPRILRKALPTPEYSSLWSKQRETLKAAGLGWGQIKETGVWEVCWWATVPEEEQQAKAEQIDASRATDAELDIPKPDGFNYLPYQRAGIAYALNHYRNGRSGCLVADEMGLGKTIQAIGVINSDPHIHRVLVICPNSLKINWSRELKKWLVRQQTIGIVEGKCFPMTDIVIINYDITDKWEKRLAFNWDLIVCDEIHYLKNAKALRAKAVFGYRPTRDEKVKGAKVEYSPDLSSGQIEALVKQFTSKKRRAPTKGEKDKLIARFKAEKSPAPTKEQMDAWGTRNTYHAIPNKRRLGLTGTPICNHPAELFPIISWLNPKEFSDFFPFGLRYCGGKQKGFGWDFSGATHLPELQEKLRFHVMVRRLKVDVLKELPAKRRQIIEFPAEEIQDLLTKERTHEERWADRLADFRSRVELAKVSDNQTGYEDAVKALEEGEGASFEEGAQVAHEIGMAKIPLVVADVEGIIETGEKVILFAHHRDVMAAYLGALKEFGAVYCDGESEVSDRQRAVDRFQNDPSCMVIIGGYKPMGVGWTLTRSSTVCCAELDWVPANMQQAEDRAHRIGQVNSVLVRLYVLAGSMDAIKAATLIRKMDISDQALDRITGPVAPGKASPTEISIQDIAVRKRRDTEARVTTVDNVQVQLDTLDEEASKLTPENIHAILEGLQQINSGCDGAAKRDDQGFGRFDTRTGKALASAPGLTSKQAVLGQRLVRKYRRQVSDGILIRAGITAPKKAAKQG